MTKRLLALLLLTAGCAVGPGYHRPELGMPATWRKSAPSSDSLRPFYDSLRTSRDTLLPPGADTARVAFAYDTTARGSGGGWGAPRRWVGLVAASVLRSPGGA